MTRAVDVDDAFDEFARAAFPGLVRLGFVLVGDRERGEDLAQHALVKVFLRWDQIVTKEAATAYARTVMVRQAGRWARRRWRGEHATDPAALVARAEHDQADDVVAAESLRSALMRLPHGQRAVVVLRYFAMNTEAEIAAMLRISQGTVKSRASRALSALRSMGVLDDVHPSPDLQRRST
jgi:RNA polymerase sigma-70 factor (sigma-E family)